MNFFFIIFFNYGSNPQPLHLTRHLTRHPPIRHFDSGGLFFCFFWFSCIIIGIQKPASPLILISRIPLFIGFIGLFLIYIYVMHPPVAICASRIGHMASPTPVPIQYLYPGNCPTFPIISRKPLFFNVFWHRKPFFRFPYIPIFLEPFFLPLFCIFLAKRYIYTFLGQKRKISLNN